MDPGLQTALIVMGSVVASSGFWAYLMKRSTAKSAVSRLLLGLAYDKIAHLGLSYIERGWISKDEYEEFRNYLYDPYKEFGGNGVAERIMDEVSHLPLRSYSKYSEIAQATRRNNKETDYGQLASPTERQNVQRPQADRYDYPSGHGGAVLRSGTDLGAA